MARDHLDRGFATERDVMQRISSEWGEHFDRMAELRDHTVKELESLGWTDEDFANDPNSLLMLLLARGIGFYDLVRIAFEHGYGVRSRNLIRSLIDIEIDAALLSTGDKDLILRYGAYEVLEIARKAEHSLARIKDSGSKIAAVEERKESLREALELLGRGLPPDHDSATLAEYADFFAKEIFQRRYPPHWRLPMKREEWISLAVQQLSKAAPFEVGGLSPDEGVRWEIDYAYMWCSEAVHVSPRSVVESTVRDGGELSGFIIGGQVFGIPASWFMATLHFVRLRLLVGAHIDITDEADWPDLYTKMVADLFDSG